MKKVFAFIILLGWLGCESDKVGSLDCNNFKTGTTQQNNEIIRAEIEKLTPDLDPVSTPEDAIGHLANLQTLTERINSNCEDINASVFCYACIETYPPLSMILVEFLFEGEKQSIIIEIVTSENDILRFGGMYENQ